MPSLSNYSLANYSLGGADTFPSSSRSLIIQDNSGTITTYSRGSERDLFTIPAMDAYTDFYVSIQSVFSNHLSGISVGITNTQIQSPITAEILLKDRGGRTIIVNSSNANRVPNQILEVRVNGLQIDKLNRRVYFKQGLDGGNGEWKDPVGPIPSAFDFSGPIRVAASHLKVVDVPASWQDKVSGVLITT